MSEDPDRDTPSSSIPKHRRKLVVWLVAVAGAIIFIAGIVLSVAVDEPVHWGYLALLVGFAMFWVAFFLWIRLAKD